MSEKKEMGETTGKRIQRLRKDAGMTQEELAEKLHVTRQALSNWERNVNAPEPGTLQQLCFLFGVHMDALVREAINMEAAEITETEQDGKAVRESAEKKEENEKMKAKKQEIIDRKTESISEIRPDTKTDMHTERRKKIVFNQYDMAIGLLYAVGACLGACIFFVGGLMTMTGTGWAASLFGGVCVAFAFGFLCHAIISLKRDDKNRKA